MSTPRDPLAAFDGEVIDAVAAERAIDRARLESIARSHQEGVRDLPGVEDIVYEWRSQFHQDPLLFRSESAYVLALQDHIWNEFIASLDITDGEADALKALHERVADTLVGDNVGREDAMVLVRP